MKRVFIFTAFCAFIAWCHICKSDDAKPAHIAHVKHFLRIYPERLESAMSLMPLVEEYSMANGFEPIVPAVVITCESAWKKNARNGPDVGLMQVRTGGLCSDGYDIDDPAQNIAAGIACLAKARDACNGTLEQTFSMYISGYCEPRTKRTDMVVKRRLWMIKKWIKQ